MGHKAIRPSEQQCPTNTYNFTDYPLTTDIHEAKQVHIFEVRNQINAELTRRERATVVFTTDPTITANQNFVKKAHIDELRSNIELIKAPSYGYPAHSCPTNQESYCPTNILGYCASDISPTITWTNVLTADQTLVTAFDMNEIMDSFNDQGTTCVCEMEQCNFCPDCGYTSTGCSYSPCWYPACYCDDHIGCSFIAACSPNSPYNTWVCATADELTNDYETAYSLNWGACSGDTNYYTDVPWNCMCNFIPPGVNWNGTYHGRNRTAWGCKCTPFNNTACTIEP